jgi:phosphoserine phosphatase RsbU/P
MTADQTTPRAAVLVAEDDPTSLKVLMIMLQRWGHEAISTINGSQAWEAIQRHDCPDLLILDWMMPGIDGLELCQRTRALEREIPPFILLLTALDRKGDVVKGLEAGANDYVTKPFNSGELRARLQVGLQMTALQRTLTQRVAERQHALEHVETLQGLMPYCMYCHKIHTSDTTWERIDHYLMEHTGAQLSHGMCPECAKKGLL